MSTPLLGAVTVPCRDLVELPIALSCQHSCLSVPIHDLNILEITCCHSCQPVTGIAENIVWLNELNTFNIHHLNTLIKNRGFLCNSQL